MALYRHLVCLFLWVLLPALPQQGQLHHTQAQPYFMATLKVSGTKAISQSEGVLKSQQCVSHLPGMGGSPKLPLGELANPRKRMRKSMDNSSMVNTRKEKSL